MSERPLVSICCVTYNHAPFIRKCLDGFLMQKTSFPVEILIHDDASSDGTDNIVKEYAERYPEKIFPLYELENQFTKGKCSLMDYEYNYSRARGKYIAYCEGDDYWTDPNKLQKQVAFMEDHPDCSVTFHDFDTWYYQEDRWEQNSCRICFEKDGGPLKLSLSLFFRRWVTQPCTMVFRTESLPNVKDLPYQYYRDQHEIFHLLKAGDGYVLSFNGAVRTKHPGGIHSGMNSCISESALAVSIAQELYRYNPLDEVKKFLLDSLDWAISLRSNQKRFNAERIKYIFKRFKLSYSIKSLVKQLLNH